MVKKKKNTIKSIEKTSFLSYENIKIGNNTYKANEVFSMGQNKALELKSSIFFKKWVIIEVKEEAK